MPEKITVKQAEALGIKMNFEKMDNEEMRFRLNGSDGSSYCRTEASMNEGWQSSHHHEKTSEFYLVQKGWMVYAELDVEGTVHFQYLKEGESITVAPSTHHNIYLSSKSVIHTIKYGGRTGERDWFPSYLLDKETRSLPEEKVIEILEKQRNSRNE